MDERMTYWEDNIEKWNLYYKYSHSKEEFEGSSSFRIIYRGIIGPIEALLMKKRYNITKKFIESKVKPGSIFNDLGCGAGIFSIQALQVGAQVNSVDFTKTALRLTSDAAKFYSLDIGKLHLMNLDLRKDSPPDANITIAMGLAPYIENIEDFLTRVFSSTEVLMCNFVDCRHPINRLRIRFPRLNVRNLIFHNPDEIDSIVFNSGFTLTEKTKLGTGFVATYVRKPVE